MLKELTQLYGEISKTQANVVIDYIKGKRICKRVLAGAAIVISEIG